MKKYKTLLLTLVLLSAAAAGCQSPAAQSTEAAEAVLTLDQQLSRTILEECAGTYARGECAAEGHKILKTEEKDGETIVYALTMYGEYEFHNGDCFVKASGSGVIPAVITYQNSESQTGGNRGWQLQSFDWPEDGSEYVKSIERMFPEEPWEICISPSEEVRKALEAQERDYAKVYLETLGREAETGEMESARKVYYNTAKAIAAAQPGVSASGQIENPVKESSPEEFAAMGITLELPENENWIQDVTYTTISDEIAQIQYYDAIAEADATLRA